MKDKKELIKKLIPLILFILAMVLATVLLWPHVSALATEEGREEFKAFIDNIGILGWFVTLGIQLLQVFVALIPGEPIELMLGFVWGPWLGMLTCLLGIFIGTLVIFLLVKRFGRPFVRKIVGDKDLSTYKFLSDPRKVDLTVFLLFFIPGTPKDLLTYFAGLTEIRLVRFLLISMLARIPSVISSTFGGHLLGEGNFTGAVILYAVTGAVSLLGMVGYDLWVKHRKNRSETA